MKTILPFFLVTLLAFAKSAAADPQPASVQISPAQVLSTLGEKVGLVICVGTSDGAFEAAIAESGKGNVLVQGVTINPQARCCCP